MTPLVRRLAERITAQGPMPFEDFMAAALYDPEHGFFSGPVLRSTKAGDFLTSPEVSADFGRALARWAAPHLTDGWVVEAGAGSGSLLRPLVAALAEAGHRPRVAAVEASPAARAALAERVPEAVVVDGLDGLPERIPGVLIANELLDNLPVAVAVWTGAGWEERWVGFDGDALGLVAAPARPEVAAWADAYAAPPDDRLPEGAVVEVQLAAWRWVEAALDRVEGPLLLIDYGDTAEGLLPRRAEGTLRTYRAHHLGPHPFDAPGETDITVDVNFSALLDLAARKGRSARLLRQEDLLAELGLREDLADLRRQELAAARAGEAMERLRLRTRRTQLETLMHPRGLGDFRALEIV